MQAGNIGNALTSMGNAMLGFAIFDMWQSSIKKAGKGHKTEGSPLLAAASAAFESYIQTAEVQNAAMIMGVAQTALTPKTSVAYGLNAAGSGTSPITVQDMAPFLALNIMA